MKSDVVAWVNAYGLCSVRLSVTGRILGELIDGNGRITSQRSTSTSTSSIIDIDIGSFVTKHYIIMNSLVIRTWKPNSSAWPLTVDLLTIDRRPVDHLSDLVEKPKVNQLGLTRTDKIELRVNPQSSLPCSLAPIHVVPPFFFCWVISML